MNIRMSRAYCVMLLLGLLQSCSPFSKEFECDAIQKRESIKDMEFKGSARFKSYGIHGLGLSKLNNCPISPPLQELYLPEGPFEDSILALNGKAWNLDKQIKANVSGKISCDDNGECEIHFSSIKGISLEK